MIVNDDLDTWASLMNASKFFRVSLTGHDEVAVLVVPDVDRPGAARDQVILAFVPDQLPSVE